MSADAERFQRRAIASGVTGSLVGFGLASVATAAVFRRPFYSKLTASVKASPFAMGTLAGFAVAGERRLLLDRRAVEEQHADAAGVALEPMRSESWVEWPQKHPFTVLALTGTPVVGAILRSNLNSSLAESAGGRLSVVLMHTRVVGQFAVLALLVGAMLLSGRGPLAWAQLQKKARDDAAAAALEGRKRATMYVDERAKM